MLLSAVSVLVVAQSSSEIPEGLMNKPVHQDYDIMTVLPVSFHVNFLVSQNVHCHMIYLYYGSLNCPVMTP